MPRLGEILMAAGIVGIPLLVFSIVAIALIAERIAFWLRLTRYQERVVRDVLTLYQQDVSLAIEKLQRHVDLPIARIFLKALSLEDAEPEELFLAMESAIQAEIPVLKRFNTVFDTIVTLSPLLGLLGTVLGLIRSFSSLNLGNIGSTQTLGVTSGISEALISTAFGLIVAVGTLFFSNTFRGLFARQVAMIQEHVADLELMHRRRHKRSEVVYATPSNPR
jgi:biopolymer transport protein ExbB